MTRTLVAAASLALAALVAAPAALAAPLPAMMQDAEAPPPPINLEPGAPVKGKDGTILGHLQDVQVNAAGAQELLVRGADRRLRAVPLNGIRQDGVGVAVDWTQRDFQAATPIEEAPRPAAPAPSPSAAPSGD